MEKILLEARKFNKECEWSKAIKKYKEIINFYDSTEIYEELSWCLSNNKQYSEAVIYLKKLSELVPNNAKYKYMIGYQYYCQENWYKAIEWFEKALELKKDYFLVKYRLAYSYYRRNGKNKSGTVDLLKSIGQINECHKLWQSYSEEQKKQKGKAYFKINFLHGKISMNLPKYRKKAIELFKTALSLNNNDDDVKYNLAKTYYLEGEYKLAKEVIPIGQKYYVLELDSFIDVKLGNYDTAISKIKKLLSKKKKGYLLRILAETYLCIENLELAFISIKEAESIDKNNHKIYYTLGKTYYKYELFKKELENLEKSISISIKNFNIEFKDSIILKEEIQEKIIRLNYTRDDDKLLNKLDSFFYKDITKTGNILKYDSKRGFGFICKGKEKIFFHCSKCNYTNINIGDDVEFNTRKTKKGLEAFDIKKI